MPKEIKFKASVKGESVVHPIELLVTSSFSKLWYEDAVKEAVTGKNNHNSIRREIIFAVCFAESYLFEWVRDEVFMNDKEELLQYSPFIARKGPKEKWKRVLKNLYEKKILPRLPDFGLGYWQEWVKLIEFRNGHIHALASIPESESRLKLKQPSPSSSERVTLFSGWATKTVFDLVSKFHHFADTLPPVWLIEPLKERR